MRLASSRTTGLWEGFSPGATPPPFSHWGSGGRGVQPAVHWEPACQQPFSSLKIPLPYQPHRSTPRLPGDGAPYPEGLNGLPESLDIINWVSKEFDLPGGPPNPFGHFFGIRRMIFSEFSSLAGFPTFNFVIFTPRLKKRVCPTKGFCLTDVVTP